MGVEVEGIDNVFFAKSTTSTYLKILHINTKKKDNI